MQLTSCLWCRDIEKSKIPKECLEEDVIVGIDEAGRGPVMGNSLNDSLLIRTNGLLCCLLGKVKKWQD